RGSVRTAVSEAECGPIGRCTFSTEYTQVGRTGAATTTVINGTVLVTDVTKGLVTNLTAGQQGTVTADVPDIFASILPTSRSVQVGTPATAFATIINTGAIRVIDCQPSLGTALAVSLASQTSDPATNQLTGEQDTPTSIPAQGSQTFVLALTPSASI